MSNPAYTPSTAKDVLGSGTKLLMNTAAAGSSTPTWTAIGNRMKLDGPKIDVESRDVSDLDSTSKKKRPGIPDFGQMSGTLWFDPNDTTHQLLQSRALNPPQTLDQFYLQYNDGLTTSASKQFLGFVQSFEMGGQEVNGTLSADFAIEITDSLTATAGTP